MRRVILIMCIFILSSSAVQAYWIQVNFVIDDCTYYDYVTNQLIEKPLYLSSFGFISLEVQDYVSTESHGYFTISNFSQTYMPSPALYAVNDYDYWEDQSFAESKVYDYYNSFELSFEARTFWHGTLQGEDDYTAYTIISSHIYLPPRNGDGTSDYPLYGDMLDQYFKYLISESIPLNIDYNYARYSQSSEYIEGFRGYGDAYITNIIYDNVLVPEQNTSTLLGFSIIALAGIRRLRRN